MTLIAQAPLLDVQMAGLSVLSVDDANRLLLAWGHRIGPIQRPFAMRLVA